MTAHDKYFGNIRENFLQPIQMRLPKEPKTFDKIFIVF